MHSKLLGRRPFYYGVTHHAKFQVFFPSIPPDGTKRLAAARAARERTAIADLFTVNFLSATTLFLLRNEFASVRFTFLLSLPVLEHVLKLFIIHARRIVAEGTKSKSIQIVVVRLT